MVRIVKEFDRRKRQWAKHRVTLNGIQAQLGLVGAASTAADHRRYDKDPRVQSSLLHRLESFYWAHEVEQMGIAIRKDYQNASVQYSQVPLWQKVKIMRVAQLKAHKYRLIMMEHMHYEPAGETDASRRHGSR